MDQSEMERGDEVGLQLQRKISCFLVLRKHRRVIALGLGAEPAGQKQHLLGVSKEEMQPCQSGMVPPFHLSRCVHGQR